MKHWLTSLTDLRKLPWWLLFAVLPALLYIIVAQAQFGVNGFPLDDAWIHQTYARNLGQRAEFAFTPGIPSVGSTSPLWSLLLSAGYGLGVPFQWWAYGWGIILLGTSGFLMARLGQRLYPKKLWLGPIVGLAVVSEWHLVWAAVSGMETILFICLSIALVYGYANKPRKPRNFALLGLVGGALTLTRPEGIGLVGLIGLFTLFRPADPSSSWRKRVTNGILLGLGALLPVLPYLIFNMVVAGKPLPNTFYAKQQEYAIVLEAQNLFQRWFNVVLVTLVGGQILLLPGLVKSIAETIQQRLRLPALITIWWFSYLTLYAVQLPVTYQHGRYQIPTIPWLLLLGIAGTASLLRRPARGWQAIAGKTVALTIPVLFALFVWQGAQAYGNDVTFIETEMVKTARWLAANTAPDDIIAAHDIGAIGYFAARPLVDLAGLITPAVIPFIRDETRLLAYARKQQAVYLVTFPSWYPAMTAPLNPVYSTNSSWAITAGYDNMSVYRIR